MNSKAVLWLSWDESLNQKMMVLFVSDFQVVHWNRIWNRIFDQQPFLESAEPPKITIFLNLYGRIRYKIKGTSFGRRNRGLIFRAGRSHALTHMHRPTPQRKTAKDVSNDSIDRVMLASVLAKGIECLPKRAKLFSVGQACQRNAFKKLKWKKNTHYLPEKRCSSGYVSGDLKLACQRNESLSDGWGKKNYPAPLN